MNVILLDREVEDTKRVRGGMGDRIANRGEQRQGPQRRYAPRGAQREQYGMPRVVRRPSIVAQSRPAWCRPASGAGATATPGLGRRELQLTRTSCHLESALVASARNSFGCGAVGSSATTKALPASVISLGGIAARPPP